MKILLLSHIFPPAIDGGSKVIYKLGQYFESQQHQTLYISSNCTSTDDFVKNKYLKSKTLLPVLENVEEEEKELTEEELLRRIIEYKKYKEISKKLKEFYQVYSKRFYKVPDKIELPARKLEQNYSKDLIEQSYKNLLEKNKSKINKNAINIEKIAITETVTVTSKVKDIFKELIKKPRFIFSKLCSAKKYTRLETVTAFSGILELTRRNKIKAQQERNFGDIIVEKASK